MKYLVWALTCVMGLSMCGLADASDTQVGAAIVLVSGTHDEQNAATSVTLPAPVFFAEHRSNRWDIFAEGISSFGQRSVSNSGFGPHSTSLSYVGSSIKYSVLANTAIGIGETLYNQRSIYQNPGISTADSSRLAGTQYELTQTLHRSANGSFVLNVAYNPHMTANLYQSTSRSSYVAISPESGTQLDTSLAIRNRHGRITVGYGLRYVDLTMHFPKGQLADQNRFIMPFAGISTSVGR